MASDVIERWRQARDPASHALAECELLLAGDALAAELQRARERIAVLEAALRPFANAYLKHDGVNRHFSEYISDDHVQDAHDVLLEKA